MISLEEAKNLSAKYRVIPLVTTLFSGSETPLSIFEKLAGETTGSFLLESAEQGVWSRYSFIGVSNLGMLIKEKSAVRWIESESSDMSDLVGSLIADSSGLDAIESMQNFFKAAPTAGLPPLVSGMVGFLSWSVVNEIEALPEPKAGSYEIPEMAFSLLRDLVVVDHADSTLKLISNLYLTDASDLGQEYAKTVARIEKLQADLLSTQLPFMAEIDSAPAIEFRRSTSDQEFSEMVDRAKMRVRLGDVFQVVVSQRFEMEVTATALDVYRSLRALNPSPYMYLLNLRDANGVFSVVGSSPEALVKVNQDSAVLHPIAGSRPRGATGEEDNLLAEDLLADKKEQAEHLMLVDLARNDLLKVCVPDSVSVTEFMTVERYSHIMHLVSTVEGKILAGATAVDVVRATFPAGTLSGAPKPMALSIIHELESINRGLFGGVVGYFDFSGNADLAIAIRTVVLRDGKAYVQAGAGIVLDSVPESENQETISKASAPLKAIAMANTMRKLS
jgi:anthranilate synthase component 1